RVPERSLDAAFSADSALMATATPLRWDVEPSVRVWDAQSGRPRTPWMRQRSFIHALAFSPDGRTLAAGAVGPTYLWDVAPGQPRARLAQPGPVWQLAFRADGRRLAAATRWGWNTPSGAAVQPGFQLWDPSNGQPIGAYAPMAEAPFMTYLPDGKTLQTLELKEGKLRRWDSDTGQPQGPEVLVQPQQTGARALFSRDGSRCLIGSSTGAVQCWDTAIGKPLLPAMVHPSPVLFLAYSPDEQTIAVGYEDATAQLWDAVTAVPVGPPIFHRLGLIGLTFTSDSRTLVTVTADGLCHNWTAPLPLPEKPALLRAWLDATTGVRVEAEEIALLADDDWCAACDRLHAQLPGSGADTRQPGPRDSWYEASARDAEQLGNSGTELLYLDHLLTIHERDGWLLARRARVNAGNGRLEQAAVDYRQAARLLPESALVNWLRHCAVECEHSRRDATGLWYLSQAIQLVPADWTLYAERAVCQAKLGKETDRERDLEAAVRLGADSDFLNRLADERARQARWEEAATLLTLAGEHGEADWSRQALVFLRVNDQARLRSLSARLCKRYQQPDNAVEANNVAATCALLSDTEADWSGPVFLARRALELLGRDLAQAHAPEDGPQARQARHAFLNTLGSVLVRAGRPEEGIKRLQEAIAAGGGEGTAHDWLFLALAHYQRGQRAKPRRWLDKARRPKTEGAAEDFWKNVELELLRHEAEALIRESCGPG